tara:strand:- start:247 stop:420 length:174 start_codon:yes stop_codon:yes gene_type:complete
MQVGDIVVYNGKISKIIQEVGTGVLVSYQERGEAIQTVEKVSKDVLSKIGETNQYNV